MKKLDKIGIAAHVGVGKTTTTRYVGPIKDRGWIIVDTENIDLVEKKMIKKIQTQKIYTFPDRKLYGEFCLLSLAELRLQIIKGEIKEQLCFIDENDRAYVYNGMGIPDAFVGFDLEEKQAKLLHEIIMAQYDLKREKELWKINN